jgi:predicted helicase
VVSKVVPRFAYEHDAAEPDLYSDAGTNPSHTRIDNITDAILPEYRKSFGLSVTKDDIFYYAYGLLHSPQYRETYVADLKKALPRIPKVADIAMFEAFTSAGRGLATLHLGYETVEPYPLTEETTGEPNDPDFYQVHKMAFGKGKGSTKDRSRVVYNSKTSVSRIPDEAYRYMLGSRSAIEWIMERYQVNTDNASGIVNDPNDWAAEHGEPRYILDLLKRIVTVSVETMKIVDGLPELEILS